MDRRFESRKKRRYWLVIAVLLSFTAVAWSNWPSGDSRFVGRWSGTSRHGNYTHKQEFVLWSNGTGASVKPDGHVSAGRFRWSANDSTFYKGPEVGRLVVEARLNLFLMRFIKGPNGASYNVEGITDGQLVLTGRSSDGEVEQITLHRITE
jgi:hypothetical protein